MLMLLSWHINSYLQILHLRSLVIALRMKDS